MNYTYRWVSRNSIGYERPGFQIAWYTISYNIRIIMFFLSISFSISFLGVADNIVMSTRYHTYMYLVWNSPSMDCRILTLINISATSIYSQDLRGQQLVVLLEYLCIVTLVNSSSLFFDMSCVLNALTLPSSLVSLSHFFQSLHSIHHLFCTFSPRVTK